MRPKDIRIYARKCIYFLLVHYIHDLNKSLDSGELICFKSFLVTKASRSVTEQPATGNSNARVTRFLRIDTPVGKNTKCGSSNCPVTSEIFFLNKTE